MVPMKGHLFNLDSDPVNGERVRQGRELRGLTQAGLAELLGVDQTMVAHIERGRKQPSTDLLEHLSSELQLPENFFRQSNPPDFPKGSLLFRSKSGIGKRIIAQAHAHSAIAFEFALRLSCQASLIPVRLPLGGDPIIAARNVRQAMAAPDGPILAITRAIERLGVLVIPLPDLRNCDAFAVWAGPARDYPVIGIITERPAGRARMSIAHELGHLVLHRHLRSGTQELEAHAYRFAAELLMPADSIVGHLAAEKLNLFRLAALKSAWGVSMQALARRARELNVINDRQYRYLMKQISMTGWRTNEPTLGPPLTPERPRAIRKLFEVVLGSTPNFKHVARKFAVSEDFLLEMIQMCAPPPRADARKSLRRKANILTFNNV
jgi:Zn-dependent peptidase ImmA (M78 family)/transcriptional regulator with XRE-family HTH domain